MPEISRFYGVIIYMYFNDHNPPHFHVKYQEYRASIAIDNLGIQEGELPPRIQGLVVRWGALYKTHLLANWENIKNEQEPDKIPPLRR